MGRHWRERRRVHFSINREERIIMVFFLFFSSSFSFLFFSFFSSALLVSLASSMEDGELMGSASKDMDVGRKTEEDAFAGSKDQGRERSKASRDAVTSHIPRKAGEQERSR
jgi:hypothetical protein